MPGSLAHLACTNARLSLRSCAVSLPLSELEPIHSPLAIPQVRFFALTLDPCLCSAKHFLLRSCPAFFVCVLVLLCLCT